MTVFDSITLAVLVVGGLLLWFGGLLFGWQRRQFRNESEMDLVKLQFQRDLNVVRSEAKKAEMHRTDAESRQKSSDTARLATEGDHSAAVLKLAQAQALISRLNIEVAELKKTKMHATQINRRLQASGQFSRELVLLQAQLDRSLAELDMERVAHASATKELEQVRRQLASVGIRSGDSKMGQRPKFETAAISMRDQPIPGVEYHRLQQICARLQQEKQQLQNEIDQLRESR